MSLTSLSKEDRAWLVRQIQDHFDSELDQTIGNMDAEFLIDFISETFGPYFYNNGLKDAQTLLSRKLEDISDELEVLEQAIIRKS